ncbi:hypothetical protein BJ875DRAFT_468999 [Amylocarpus encephaloides]|uniref:BZIP domain-containing protein n=1 Tax=Amylocarpus encephaloides TaxID=45428 RepID=A0A9P8C445_9HELO|nr:hypothetical protein BJ875DRAFT_468999 [Amylocarpus encephaloides]
MTYQPSIQQPRILVRRMLDVAELRDISEDWTGKSNTAERRKLQNRLNQRKRRAQAKAAASNNETTSVSKGEVPITVVRQEEIPLSKELYVPTWAPLRPFSIEEICISPAQKALLLAARSFASYYKQHTSLPIDQQLLPLLHFNLVRALCQNIQLLGVNPAHMHLDIPSPFHSLRPRPYLPALLPPGLKPTGTQLEVPHHPQLDVLPYPECRDRLIRMQDTIDDAELCRDIIFGVDNPSWVVEIPQDVDMRDTCNSVCNERTGLIVWSDPWNKDAWEVQEAFAVKYKTLLCDELVASTNAWRERRGEELLDSY